MARTKQLEKPFSFHDRDLNNLQSKKLDSEKATEVADFAVNQFRARIVPWSVLIPKYKMMTTKEEYERIQRIKANAEENYKAASLPPRM